MISCVVLTKNEENNIIDCLESLSWCGEIIVVDDYSDDRTREIIKNYNDSGPVKISTDFQGKQARMTEKKSKIYQRHLSGDFAKQRNFGLEKATGEWVLFVDADERVTPELREEILEHLPADATHQALQAGVQDDEKKYDGFYIRRKDFLFGRWLKHGETGNIKFVRLIRKNKARWERKVHERLGIRQLADGTLGTLKEPLLHYPHQTINEFLKKINFYTDLNAKELYKNYRHAEFSSASRRILKQVQDDASIIIYPLAKFMQNYFLKLGFLDGMAGFLLAMLMSFHSFLTRGKLWEMYDSGQARMTERILKQVQNDGLQLEIYD